MMNLPAIKVSRLGHLHIIIAPTVNKTSAIMIVGFLPIISDKGPISMAPTAPPITARDTMS